MVMQYQQFMKWQQQQQQQSSMTDGSFLSLLTENMTMDDFLVETRNMLGDFSIPSVGTGLETRQGQAPEGSGDRNGNGGGTDTNRNKRQRTER
jgi:hypothetical protein